MLDPTSSLYKQGHWNKTELRFSDFANVDNIVDELCRIVTVLLYISDRNVFREILSANEKLFQELQAFEIAFNRVDHQKIELAKRWKNYMS